MIKNQYIVLTISITVLVLSSFSSVYALTINAGQLTTYTTQTESSKIGVQLSQGCITALKNHIPVGCPTYQTLAIADNTTRGYYGKIVNDTNGFSHRSKPTAPNYYNVIHENHWVVAVDPTQQFIEGQKTQMIIVMPPGTLAGYTDPSQSVGDNHTRIEYHDRYVDSLCKEARIAYSYTLYIDTISYLESGCKTTTYSDHSIKQTGNQPVTLDNPFSSLLYTSYKKQLLNGHSIFGNQTTGGLGIGNCINTICSYKDPYKKAGW
jgi:hypothetical protein